MKRDKDVEIPTCFYCGVLLAADAIEYDHFPIPKRNGGTDTVPCCVPCHDMKDRFGFNNWPIDWMVHVWADFPKLSRETRIALAMITATMSDIIEERRKRREAAEKVSA